MNCPDCKAKTTVRYTKTEKTGVMRYRRCPECGRTFQTRETIDHYTEHRGPKYAPCVYNPGVECRGYVACVVCPWGEKEAARS